jgi:hypothetical protein
VSLIDETKYYNVFNNEASFYQRYRDLGYVNELAKYWHHGEEPHRLYAKELIDYMEANKWEL